MYVYRKRNFFFFFFFLRMIETGIIYVTVACLIIFWCRLKKTKGGLGITEIFLIISSLKKKKKIDHF